MSDLIQYSIYILLLPLFSFAVQIFFGKKLPRNGDFLATGIIAVSLGLSLYVAFSALGQENFQQEWNFTWANLGTMEIKLGILIDKITAVMLIVVTGISFLVHFFSIGYMAGEPRYERYFGYLGIFTFSMLGIVLSNNLFAIYCFWELVGLSSFLLIGFYFERDSAAAAQKKAFMLNRVGDIGFWLGILMLFAQFQTFNYQEIYQNIGEGKFTWGEGWLTVAGVLLFMGCVGKSAQFPLHTWLPDAMEGPTPVSALIHAATMVAAGVYLLARVFVILTPDALAIIAVIGAVTAFFAATIAITQNDIKRVLAYSTLSQLGYMVMGMGVGAFAAALFHLVTHAFFKAGLFLGSGSVIHAMHHEQDMRYMGGLMKKMPITFATFTICLFALAGLPLFSGFLSKDAILAGAVGYANVEGSWAMLVPVLGFSAALLTPLYMGRQWFMVFFGNNRADEKLASADDHHHHGHGDNHHHGEIHESAPVMTIPLVILAAMSFFFVFSPNPLDGEKGWFMNAVKTPETKVAVTQEGLQGAAQVFSAIGGGEPIAPETPHADETHSGTAHFQDLRQQKLAEASHHAHGTVVTLSISLALLGLVLAYLAYLKNIGAIASPFVLLSKMMNWFNDTFMEGAFVKGIGNLGVKFSSFSGGFDKLVVDGIVNLSATLVQIGGLLFRKLQTGRVQTYIALLLIAVIGYFVSKLV
ncbi:MAG: NADH-quinone oxidoreductase subunit L [Chloroherpetonaceae bacterium]